MINIFRIFNISRSFTARFVSAAGHFIFAAAPRLIFAVEGLVFAAARHFLSVARTKELSRRQFSLTPPAPCLSGRTAHGFAATIAVILLSMATFSIPATPALAAEPPAGTITAASGEVCSRTGESGQWTAAREGTELAEGSFVMTAFESGCSIRLADGSTIKVNELSKIRVSKFAKTFDSVSADISLYGGKIRATVHKDVTVKTEFRVKTPVSIIAVRGTEKEISYSPGFGSSVRNISGLIEVTNHIGQSATIARSETTAVRTAERKPDRVSQIFRDGARTGVFKNESLTLDEDETMQDFGAPRLDIERAGLRDLMQLYQEKSIYPTTIMSFGW